VNFSPNQQLAIDQPGNLLVLAGAGSGKTRTLVQRCLNAVLRPEQDVGIDEMLVVTYTISAAAELRQRVREGLLETLSNPAHREYAPWIEKQLALIESAHISTLHSFCLHLIREHFHELQLDPAVAVLREEQVRFLMEQTLDAVLNPHFEESRDGFDVHELIETYGGGDDQAIRQFILRVHNYSQTLANPEQWLAAQRSRFEDGGNFMWDKLLAEAFADWCGTWLDELESAPVDAARQFAARMRHFQHPVARTEIASFTAHAAASREDWPRGTAEYRKRLEKFYDDAEFLQSVAMADPKGDPLIEDWEWARPHMQTLLRLTSEFSVAYARAKREQGALDFHDLEQFALELLLGPKRAGPTPLAEQWRRRLRFVLVDECQDINASQEAILRAVARDRDESNLFLVGDVKQSIFRFRLAEPSILQNYRSSWQSNPKLGRVIPLAENFRSSQILLDFINQLFIGLMRSSIGGVEYDKDAELKFGDTERLEIPGPCVELHLRVTDKVQEEDEEADNSTDIEIEARLVAKRLRELHDAKHEIWDSQRKALREMDWRDVAVLLRSPRGRADIYAQEFAAAGIPLQVQRGGLFDSIEVSDALSLLQILDNPLRDVPLLAVLRSPLVGLSLDELAVIRLAKTHALFWRALELWRSGNPRAEDEATWQKVDLFLQRFRRWRMRRQWALSERLEEMLAETHYWEWLLTQPRASQREANLRRFIRLAQQFDPFQRQGLQRFLSFVEAQREAKVDSEATAFDGTDAVRLMSIHASKGLEFTVVVMADMGKPFNFRDLYDRVLLDRQLGLCPQIKPPGTGSFYPSLLSWLSSKRERRELAGEEMRLLYVAMTRARDTLLLVGTATRKQAERWVDSELTTRRIAAATKYLDWVGPVCSRQTADRDWLNHPEGRAPLFRWKIYGPVERRSTAAVKQAVRSPMPAPAEIARIIDRIEWRYPWLAATREAAKLSVSELRKRGEQDAESGLPFRRTFVRPRRNRHQLSAAEIGTLNHLFLQMLDLRQLGTVEQLRAQADALVTRRVLTNQEIAVLDWKAILNFWHSELGRRIAAVPDAVHREIPFTARFSRKELEEAGMPCNFPDGEFTVVQGAVDLAVILKGEIWIVDFKTDAISLPEVSQLVSTYGAQLRLYASALSRIYNRPVSERWLYFLSLSQTIAV